MMRETLEASTWFMAVGDFKERAFTFSTGGFCGLIRPRRNAWYGPALGARAFRTGVSGRTAYAHDSESKSPVAFFTSLVLV